jgi:hypothetical protein
LALGAADTLELANEVVKRSLANELEPANWVIFRHSRDVDAVHTRDALPWDMGDSDSPRIGQQRLYGRGNIGVSHTPGNPAAGSHRCGQGSLQGGGQPLGR